MGYIGGINFESTLLARGTNGAEIFIWIHFIYSVIINNVDGNFTCPTKHLGTFPTW